MENVRADHDQKSREGEQRSRQPKRRQPKRRREREKQVKNELFSQSITCLAKWQALSGAVKIS